MSKRINIGISDEFHSWLVAQAKESGIPVSSYATMLLNQARRDLEAKELTQVYMRQFAKLPPNLLSAELTRVAFDDSKQNE